MFLVDWILNMFGGWLWTVEANVLMLGLDNAGKTTLSGLLHTDTIQVHEPTSHPTSAELKVGCVTMKTFDMGGHESARRLWKNYYSSVGGVIFIVDASDLERIGEARSEFTKLMASDMMKNIPILILGNKIDRPRALSLSSLTAEMGVSHLDDNVVVMMCSVVRRVGVSDALKWLSGRISSH